MADNSSEASPSKPSVSPKLEEKQAGGWWDSWLTSAKTKSAEVYCMVKKDLDEIGSAVKSEASHVFSSTSTVIGKTLKLDEPESPANVMKKSFSSFIGQVNTVLNPEPDDEEDTEVILSSGDTTMLSTYKKELESLQRVDATFLVPCAGAQFVSWRASQEGGGGGARRLRGGALQDQYEKLVPDAVSHDDFWERYMFRVALLQDRLAAEARQQPRDPSSDPVVAHLPRHEPPVILDSPKKTLSLSDTESPEPEVLPEIDHAVTWEDGDAFTEDFASEVELTEEQQILLLEEYEKEIASKKSTKETSTNITNNNMKNKMTNTKTATKPTNTKPTTAKTSNPKPKQAQIRDKQNNKNTDKKTPVPAKNKNGSPKKPAKSDVCGNNLVEDYFADKEVAKDDASANSDESWEKVFEIEDVKKAA